MVATLFQTQKKYLDYFYDQIDISKTEEILQTLLLCEGNVVLTGVGKSGIIANKLAMTLLSTGTKSFYISPTNALHGDLGMVSKEDIFICLSNSGETKELLSLAPFVKRKGAIFISIVSRAGCTLAKFADHFIVLPVKREICPYNLAPTTSTAVQLIFGDVLAIELMRRKNFTLDKYAENHPAGVIGKATLQVKDLMLTGKDIPFCKKEDQLIDVLSILSEKRCGALIVTDDNKALLGIFTDGDLRRVIELDREKFLYKKMEELMTKNPKWIDKEFLATQAIHEMEREEKKRVMVLPVLKKGGKVVGIIHMHDIIQAGLKR